MVVYKVNQIWLGSFTRSTFSFLLHCSLVQKGWKISKIIFSNAFPLQKCLASNRFQMQSNTQPNIIWRHKNIQNSTVSILVRHFFSGMERALFNQLYFVQEFLNTFNFSGMSLAYSNGLADGLGHIVNVVGGDPSH